MADQPKDDNPKLDKNLPDDTNLTDPSEGQGTPGTDAPDKAADKVKDDGLGTAGGDDGGDSSGSDADKVNTKTE